MKGGSMKKVFLLLAALFTLTSCLAAETSTATIITVADRNFAQAGASALAEANASLRELGAAIDDKLGVIVSDGKVSAVEFEGLKDSVETFLETKKIAQTKLKLYSLGEKLLGIKPEVIGLVQSDKSISAKRKIIAELTGCDVMLERRKSFIEKIIYPPNWFGTRWATE